MKRLLFTPPKIVREIKINKADIGGTGGMPRGNK
jgi:hypothetical protein